MNIKNEPRLHCPKCKRPVERLIPCIVGKTLVKRCRVCANQLKKVQVRYAA